MSNFEITLEIMNTIINSEKELSSKMIATIMNKNGFQVDKKTINQFVYKMKDLGLIIQNASQSPPTYSSKCIKIS